MTRLHIFVLMAAALMAAGAQDAPYEQHQDLVYGEAHGVGLLMDVFVPKGEKNGLAIVDVASGAWHSDRGKIRDHQQARLYDNLAAKGFTTFAIRPGSRTKFTAEDMLANVKTGIRWVKAHAADYGIDPERIGLTGASAGAHLAALAVVRTEDGDPTARDPLKRYGTRVAAVGIFFPPTNFLQWGTQGEPNFGLIGDLLFPGGILGRSDEEVREKAKAISPALHVTAGLPPFLIWHGDADPLVPLQQSEFFVEQLKAKGNAVEFHVKAGGGHPWLTIPEEVAQMTAWFDAKLRGD